MSSLGNLTCKMLHGLESGGKATVSMALEGHPIVFWTGRMLGIHTEGTTIVILKDDGGSNIRTAFRMPKMFKEIKEWVLN